MQGTKAIVTPGTRSVTEADPPAAKEVKGKPGQKVRHKKIRPRKKAGKQTRTIVVTVLTEGEEIRDAGATMKRKRGRPRRPKKANSPDPHKGSVLDYEEGVCADPGKGDATLWVGGPGPPEGNSGQQLRPDRGGEKTAR